MPISPASRGKQRLFVISDDAIFEPVEDRCLNEEGPDELGGELHETGPARGGFISVSQET